jgi:hypothetical protein
MAKAPTKVKGAADAKAGTTSAKAAAKPAAATASPHAVDAVATSASSAGLATQDEAPKGAEPGVVQESTAVTANQVVLPRAADPTAKSRYSVDIVPIRHDGEVYGVGQEIRLTDREANRLAGLLTPITQ